MMEEEVIRLKLDVQSVKSKVGIFLRQLVFFVVSAQASTNSLPHKKEQGQNLKGKSKKTHGLR